MPTPLRDPAEALQELEKGALHPFTAAWADLDASLWRGTTDGIHPLAEAHRALVDRLGLTAGIEGADGWDRLEAYREEVAGTVQKPFTQLLRTIDPMAKVSAARDGAEDAAWKLGSSLPAAATMGWDDDAMAPRPDQARLRGAGNALVRVMRRIRSRAPRPMVPLRSLAHHLLLREIVPAQRRCFEDAHRSWARWTGTLERAWDAWARELLRPPPPPAAETADEEALSANRAMEQGRFADAVAAITGLQKALDDATESPPHDGARQAAADTLGHAAIRFADELPWAGTSALRLRGVREQPAPAKARSGPSWGDWFSHAVNRFALHGELLQVVLGCQSAVMTFEGRLARILGSDLDTRCAEGAGALRRRAAALATEGRLAMVLPAARAEAEQWVTDGLGALPDPVRLEASVGGAADQLSEAVHALTRGVPSALILHELPPASGPLTRPTEGRPVKLQEIARQTFDVIRTEAIRTTPLQIVPRISELAAAAEGIHDVLAFGCDSALAELEGGEEGSPDRALTLAKEGFERAADALAELPRAVEGATGTIQSLVEAEAAVGWSRLVDRGLAQGMQGQILDARSSFLHSVGEFRERWTPHVVRAGGWIKTRWQRGRVAVSGLLSRGRRMVGASGAAPAGHRAAKALAESDELYAALPLVYQRLFSLKPLSDPALLLARDELLAEIEARADAWRDEDGIPLVVYGRPGVGVSSLFLVLFERLTARGFRAVHHVLDRRFHDEAALAAYLSQVLGLAPADDLDDLTLAILGAPKETIPDLLALEGLEHVYLRVPGGTDLVERMLTMMSETEPRMFWIASSTQSAWQLIRKAEPTAVSQVEQIELPPLGADEIRQAVLARHRRSGVPIGYEEPTEGRHLLRRRLRRIQGADARKEVMEQDFFEKLHNASGGNLRLALYHWLLATDFASVPGELRVRPVAPVDFSFLNGLELTQNFTLKALLEHRSLTLADHDAIFRLPRQESFQVMESLLNRYLVQAVPDPESGEAASAGQDLRRYRIIPLIAGAVSAHLAGRNIVH